jgi:DNA adenine methylase
MLTSPLRYPGGKAKLFDFMTAVLRHNNLFNTSYCEPYAGGAGLALKLLSAGFVGRILLNDVDPAIHAFWVTALRDTEKLCKKIAAVDFTMDEWHRQQKIYKRGDATKTFQLGFATYFLNRTNRSGIILHGGPIGGYEQTGEWKIDARMNKSRQIDQLLALSNFADRIEVTNLDALEFLRTTSKVPNRFLYLDPPYYNKGRRLYENHYQHADHEKIMRFLRTRRKQNWVLSYDDVPEIRDIYDEFKPIRYSLSYSANEKMVGREVIYLSDTLTMPKLQGFKVAA